MKIVIDISSEDFENVKCGRGAVSMMRKAIIHGTPLPEGAEILTKEAYSDLCTRAAEQPDKRTEERTESHACGCISRQAAIDAIGNVPDHDDGMVWEALSRAQWNVALLPLVTQQPEVIRCKDCKHWTNNIGDSELRDNYCNEEAHGFYYRCSGDDYCSFAERRTDE